MKNNIFYIFKMKSRKTCPINNSAVKIENQQQSILFLLMRKQKVPFLSWCIKKINVYLCSCLFDLLSWNWSPACFTHYFLSSVSLWSFFFSLKKPCYTSLPPSFLLPSSSSPTLPRLSKQHPNEWKVFSVMQLYGIRMIVLTL